MLCYEHQHIELCGLQGLEEDDLRYLHLWVDERLSYIPNRSDTLPWIWKVQMLGTESNNDGQGLKNAIKNWESEGCSISSSWRSLLILSEARRLEWVHLFTSLERWKEEVLLLQEELRRL